MNLNLDFAAILERWPAFLDGAVLTLQLAFIATVLVRSQGTGSVVTDLEREVVEERRAQGLPPRITNPVILRRVASLITAPTPISTNSGMAPERAAGRADQQAS